MIRYFLFNFISFCAVIRFLAKSLVPVVSTTLTFLTSSSYTVFLTTSFSTTLFSLLKSARVVSKLPISDLSISYFKLAKSTFLANSNISTPAAFFMSDFVV